MLQFKTIKQFSKESGYSEKSIRHKLDKGVWGTGIRFKAPDGRVLISTEGFERWVQGTQVFQQTVNRQSDLGLCTLENASPKLSKARLPNLT
jgi:hypothetical protein